MDSAIAEEAFMIVRQAALPIQPGDTIKAQINRAWVSLGRPPHWRVRASWYREAGGFSAAAIHDLQTRFRAMQAKRSKANVSADLLHAARLDSAALALERIDADFHRDEVDRLRLLARSLRDSASHGSVAEGLTDHDPKGR